MADADNRRRGRTFREAVAASLDLAGVAGARARQAGGRRTSEVLDDDAPPAPDILGRPGGWYLATHADVAPRLGTSLDAAEQAAGLAGFDRAALVQYRRARPVGDAYVIMTLDTLATILRRDQADWSNPAEFERWAAEQVAREE